MTFNPYFDLKKRKISLQEPNEISNVIVPLKKLMTRFMNDTQQLTR